MLGSPKRSTPRSPATATASPTLRHLRRQHRLVPACRDLLCDDDLDALNLYFRNAGAFGDESENVGLLFASHAAIAMAGSRKEHDLALAVSARDVIGQAKGILVERHRVTD